MVLSEITSRWLTPRSDADVQVQTVADVIECAPRFLQELSFFLVSFIITPLANLLLRLERGGNCEGNA